MTPFKKVLVPIDFSPHSDHALDVALELCKRFDAALAIVHVYQPVVYAGVNGYMLPPSATEQELPKLLLQREEQLGRARDAALAAGAREVEAKLLHGGVTANEIAEFARAGGYELIVMGTHGRTGLGRVMLGSV